MLRQGPGQGHQPRSARRPDQSRDRELAGQIAQTYGPHTRVRDALSQRSDLKGADEWTQAVEEDERTFSYDWTGGSYPHSINSIHVFASATDGETGYAVAEFYFKNHRSCDEELDKEAF